MGSNPTTGTCARLAERLIALVLKTGGRQRPTGSNPVSRANGDVAQFGRRGKLKPCYSASSSLAIATYAAVVQRKERRGHPPADLGSNPKGCTGESPTLLLPHIEVM